MAQFALKWILVQEAVSTVIAGGKRPEQVLENSQASELANLSTETIAKIKEIYDSSIKKQVHYRW
jgi:aryl-alcohol dehydrogenase-like predicted oxidoreductase